MPASPENVAYAGDRPAAPGAAARRFAECTIVGKVHAKLIDSSPRTASSSRALGRRPRNLDRAGPRRTPPGRAACASASCRRARSRRAATAACRTRHHPDALPHFTSLRYGDPGYGQLRRVTDKSIRDGADDEGEMGVLHALFQPQRETNLRIRLDEYLRFGLHAGSSTRPERYRDLENIMGADFSRVRLNPLLDYAGVELQAGRRPARRATPTS